MRLSKANVAARIGGYALSDMGIAEQEAEPIGVRDCTVHDVGGAWIVIKSRGDRGMRPREYRLFCGCAPEMETAECARSRRNAQNFQNPVRLCGNVQEEWYSCLVSNQGPSDPQSDALTN